MTEFSKHDMKVGNHLYFERGELIDDALYAELNNVSFSKHKADKLEEIKEQIRLIENITDENQAQYFDPQLNCHNIAVDVAAYNFLHAVPANKEWAERRLMEETEKRNKYITDSSKR